jgi:hypothetical protein
VALPPLDTDVGSGFVPAGPDDRPPSTVDVAFTTTTFPANLFAGTASAFVGGWILLTTFGVAMFIMGLRRRSGPTPGGQAAAADGGIVEPGEPAGIGDPAPPPNEGRLIESEAMIPRWRRPSLQAARQSSYAMSSSVRQALRFATPRPAGAARAQIAYRLVRVGDSPDDTAAEEIGRLDRGDEVEVVRAEKGFTLVRAPNGLEGWVATETLNPTDGSGGAATEQVSPVEPPVGPRSARPPSPSRRRSESRGHRGR